MQLPPTAEQYPFGQYEEDAIVALILDYPEFFSGISRFITHELFSKLEVQYVVAHIMQYYESYGSFPTRGMLLDGIKRKLTVDDPGYEQILSVANRPSDPREVSAIKDRLTDWARSKAYGLLYDADVITKFHSGDFEAIEEVFNKARTIQDLGNSSMWFFDELEKLFVESTVEHFTSSFVQLDHHLNNGGPSRKEVLVWMAPTGVGKSIVLANNAISNVLRGRKVLYITFELSDVMSAIRMLGTITGRPIDGRRFDYKEQMMAMITRLRQGGEVGDLVIHEFPPDEVSVDGIYALVEHLRRSKGWNPDIICLDYLELMVSRRVSDNKDEYLKQKSVTTQVRGLAKNLNVCVFTATQTNRSGNDSSGVIDVTKMAESYGKAMPIDYLVSINQSSDEYRAQFDAHGNSVAPAFARMYIAKNRNGKKFQTIAVKINYNTMQIQEVV